MNDFENMYGDYTPPTGLEKAANALRKVGHALSMIPVLGLVSGLPVAAAAILESTDGYFNKGFGSGTKSLTSGMGDTLVTAAIGASWWMPVNWIAGLASGDSLGELARKGINGVLDSFIPDSFSGRKNDVQLAREAQVLGSNPMTMGALPAGVGYAMPMQQHMAMQAPVNPATQQPVQPNQWTDMVAQQRGQTPEQARASWVANNREDALALQRAAQGPQQLGAS